MKSFFSQIAPLLIPLIIVGGLAYLVTRAPQASELAYAPVEYTGSDVIAGPQSSGAYVQIQSAEIKTPSFISIHESITQAPAQSIGYSGLLPAGSYADIPVTLSQTMLPGYRYIVLLMADTNSNGQFDIGVDLPIMSDGAVVRQDVIADALVQ